MARRIILSNCRKLKQYTQRGVSISPDEAVEVRRKTTLDRLKFRAEHAGQRVSVNDGILKIDDVVVFSSRDGYVHTHNNNNSDG